MHKLATLPEIITFIKRSGLDWGRVNFLHNSLYDAYFGIVTKTVMITG